MGKKNDKLIAELVEVIRAKDAAIETLIEEGYELELDAIDKSDMLMLERPQAMAMAFSKYLKETEEK